MIRLVEDDLDTPASALCRRPMRVVAEENRMREIDLVNTIQVSVIGLDEAVGHKIRTT